MVPLKLNLHIFKFGLTFLGSSKGILGRELVSLECVPYESFHLLRNRRSSFLFFIFEVMNECSVNKISYFWQK
jgi:hypothetical protein